jgi:hypothetical protein
MRLMPLALTIVVPNDLPVATSCSIPGPAAELKYNVSHGQHSTAVHDCYCSMSKSASYAPAKAIYETSIG